jgi:hypothetical protein
MKTEVPPSESAVQEPIDWFDQSLFLPVVLRRLQTVVDGRPPRRSSSAFYQDESYWCMPFNKPISQLSTELV